MHLAMEVSQSADRWLGAAALGLALDCLTTRIAGETWPVARPPAPRSGWCGSDGVSRRDTPPVLLVPLVTPAGTRTSARPPEPSLSSGLVRPTNADDVHASRIGLLFAAKKHVHELARAAGRFLATPRSHVLALACVARHRQKQRRVDREGHTGCRLVQGVSG